MGVRMQLLPYKCENCEKVFKADSKELTIKKGRYLCFCPYCGKKQEKL